MSGIFLIVSDENYDQSKVLRTTSGGYPHITFFYSGQLFKKRFLIDRGRHTLRLMKKEQSWKFTLTAENARLNTFYHEKKKGNRYDVLLHLTEEGFKTIWDLRASVCSGIPPEQRKTLSMGDPHVTHSIHWSEAEALASLEEVKKHLPVEITVTGYTIE